MDETLALPSRKAAEIALRTQQLLAYETGVANVVDPLGGGWFIESLTDRLEEFAEQYFTKIENLGGVIPAIEQGYFQKEIAKAAADYQRKVDHKQRIVVGVNEFEKPGEKIEIPILKLGKESEENQIAAINKIREKRDNQYANDSLKQIGEACQNGGNVMAPIIQAAKADVTLGEIVQKMKDIFGEWQETAVI